MSDRRAVKRMRSLPGMVMVEALLLLFILLAIFVVAYRVAPLMLNKSRLTTDVRFRVWRVPAQHHHVWDVDSDHTWTHHNINAGGSIFTPAVSLGSFGEWEMKRPRGDGEALENLYSRIGSDVADASSHALAQDFMNRLWNNLPGRKELKRSEEYNVDERINLSEAVSGSYWSYYTTDMATWVHSQMPAWLIAQNSPMRDINMTFTQELSNVPQEFRRMAREVLHAWFEEEHMYSWNNPNAVQP